MLFIEYILLGCFMHFVVQWGDDEYWRWYCSIPRYLKLPLSLAEIMAWPFTVWPRIVNNVRKALKQFRDNA